MVAGGTGPDKEVEDDDDVNAVSVALEHVAVVAEDEKEVEVPVAVAVAVLNDPVVVADDTSQHTVVVDDVADVVETLDNVLVGDDAVVENRADVVGRVDGAVGTAPNRRSR